MGQNLRVNLHIADCSGILSSAITAVRRSGLHFEGHQFDDAEVGRQLTLRASGELEDPLALRAKLEGIKGVISVEGLDEAPPLEADASMRRRAG